MKLKPTIVRLLPLFTGTALGLLLIAALEAHMAPRLNQRAVFLSRVDQLGPGMSESQVTATLGKPTLIEEIPEPDGFPSEERLYYQIPGTSHEQDRVELDFDASGHLSR